MSSSLTTGTSLRLKRSESEDCRAVAQRRRAAGHTLETDASSFDPASQPDLKRSEARAKGCRAESRKAGEGGLSKTHHTQTLQASTRQASRTSAPVCPLTLFNPLITVLTLWLDSFQSNARLTT